MAKKHKNNQSYKINFWGMMQNVLIASMSKGQFPPACGFLVFIIMIIKMPSSDVSKLVFDIWDSVKQGQFIGDILAVVFLIGWFIHARWQRRLIAKEMERIGIEKSKYQQGQIPGSESSES